MLAEYFIVFHNEFNKLNNTGVRVLDSVYHMTHIQITFLCENVYILPLFTQQFYKRHYGMLRKSVNNHCKF